MDEEDKPTGETYELKTIEDIYKKVPERRWSICMAELIMTFCHAKAVERDTSSAPKFKRIRWVDDGKGELTANYTVRTKI